MDRGTVRKGLAGGMCILVVVSYVTCISITKARGVYTGGLDFPYFSDTGRDPPSYYVFAVLNTIAGAMMVGFMPLQYLYVTAWLDSVEEVNPKAKHYAATATILGMLGGVAAALTSIFDTSRYPDVHDSTAYAFFCCLLLYTGVTELLYTMITNSGAEGFKRTRILRYAALGILAVGFVLYLPVGLGVVCEFENLSMAECLRIESPSYCDDHEHSSKENMTNLWDYSGCKEVNTMRSSSQFVSIISLMCYVALHVLDPPLHSDNGPDDEDKEST